MKLFISEQRTFYTLITTHSNLFLTMIQLLCNYTQGFSETSKLVKEDN